MRKFSFPSSLKLKSEKSISELFKKGKNLSKPPLRILYQIDRSKPSLYPKATFSVSKRIFKRAVDRNRIKRIMREAYRLNRDIIFREPDRIPAGLEIIFLYSSKEVNDYKTISESMTVLLNELKARISQS
jgi:ribonuclease P protein component